MSRTTQNTEEDSMVSIKKANEPQLTSEQFEEEIKQNKAKLSENDRIKFLVVRVCEDSPKTFMLSIQKLAEQIIEYSTRPEKREYKDVLIRYLVDSVSLLSFKQSVYATVLSLVLQKSKPTFEDILKRITDQLQASLDAGERIKARNILIFLGELMVIGVINCYAYKELVMSILTESENGLKAISKSGKVREFYLWIVISSLGYASEYLKKKIGSEYDVIAEAINRLIALRDTSYLSLYKAGYEKSRDLDTIQVLWASIQKDAASASSEDTKVTEGTNILHLVKLFESQLQDIEQQEFTFALEFKNRSDAKCIYSAPLFVSNVLKTEEEIEEINQREEQDDEQEMEEEDQQDEDEDEEQDHRGKKEKSKKPAQKSVKAGDKVNCLFKLTTQRLLILENIDLTIDLFGESKKNLFQQFQMILRVIIDEEPKFIFAALVDQLICRTVRPKGPSGAGQTGLLNSSLANTLFALQREDSDAILLKIFSQINNKITDLTMDSVEQLAEFLSHVISDNHLQFQWEQVNIGKISKSDVVNSVDQRVLLWRDVIQKLCSLCGRDKVTAALVGKVDDVASSPQSSLALFLTPVSAKEVIVTRYQSNEDGLAKRFMDKLVQKKSSEEIGEDIKAAVKESLGTEEEEDEERKFQVVSHVVGVFLECLFFRSCETFTHLKILYDRYQVLLKSMQNDYGLELVGQAIIDTLLQFWQNNYFSLEIYLKKFIVNGFITAQAIVESIFNHIDDLDITQGKRQVHQLWLFLRRITHNVIETSRNYSIESNQQNSSAKSIIEQETIAHKIEQANEQQQDLLALLFSRFQQVFADKQMNKPVVEEKQYVTYFVYFFRRYSNLVEWDAHYKKHFTSIPLLSQSVLNSY